MAAKTKTPKTEAEPPADEPTRPRTTVKRPVSPETRAWIDGAGRPKATRNPDAGGTALPLR